MENEVLTRLRQLAELLADESRWTTKVLARDSRDWPVTETSDRACKWCLVGGLEKVCWDAPRGTAGAVFRYLQLAAAASSDASLASINDYQGHVSVMNVIHQAIVLASA